MSTTKNAVMFLPKRYFAKVQRGSLKNIPLSKFCNRYLNLIPKFLFCIFGT